MPRSQVPARVLVVEDEPLIAMEVEATLLDGGFEVLGPAPSVGAALGLLKADVPDCAVLDVSLRGELVTPVAELLVLLHVPFVLTSAYGRSDYASDVLSGARNLGKPTNPDKLVEAVLALVAQ
jgi:two-component system, response regulator PdtaR